MTNESLNMSSQTELEFGTDIIEETALVSKVILYNDEWHTFDEVINQIIIATGYTYEKAAKITNQVHSEGKAIVYSGEMITCISISSILEEIMLLTEIEL